MNKPFTIKILSGLINVITCLVIITIILYFQNWFDSSDTYSFIFWTIPLAVGVSFCGDLFLQLFRTTRFALRLLIIFILAVLFSFYWCLCINLYLGPWIAAFGIPFLYLWIAGSFAQLLFLEYRLPKKNSNQKTLNVLLGLLAFPFIPIATILIMYSFSCVVSVLTRPEKETFLIPQNYSGNIYIIYNQKNCVAKEYENDRRIYRIPDNGILLTQFEDEYGRVDQEYYFVDKVGKRTKLKSTTTSIINNGSSTKNEQNLLADSVKVFPLATGRTGNNTEGETEIIYCNVFVGSTKQMKGSNNRLNYQLVDSIRTEYLKNKPVN